MAISKSEVLMNRDKTHAKDYIPEVSSNIDKLLICLNKFREAYGKAMTVSSGWRPASINAAIGGAKKSNHTVGLACDFADKDGNLAKFALEMDKIGKLKEWGLWLENPEKTKNWIHLDIKDRGNRSSNVFNP